MGVGSSKNRVDAWEKVTGQAKYTADLMPQNLYTAKVVHSTIANGWVKSFDLEEALKVPGVVKIVTCFDVPDIQFPTPGHPWSVEKAHQDIKDRKLLNRRVRMYGCLLYTSRNTNRHTSGLKKRISVLCRVLWECREERSKMLLWTG